ncbi:MAG: UvrD-helicase domain-containing protein [Candidatus Omnitrophica bacterium]|nr:UvrD-helicase domain-containing protein [Candidatus Omnitrophota bacterium]
MKFPHVKIVEASAGSGKTYCLATRYLQLLLAPGLKESGRGLKSILAVTFTNKAALEMKERILEFLKRIALDSFMTREGREALLAELNHPTSGAAHLLVSGLLRNYNFFQVQTIDSFINAVLSGCAFKLDLSANFRTEREYDEYLTYSLDALVDAAAEDKDIYNLFQKFLRQYLYIEHKTGWFPRRHIQEAVSALFTQHNIYDGALISGSAGPEESATLKQQIMRGLDQLHNELPEHTHGQFRNSLESFLAKHHEAFSVDALSAYFTREDFPVRKGGVVPAGIAKRWRKIRDQIRELCELESASAYNYYVEIFTRVFERLKEAAGREDVLFLGALNKEARALLAAQNLGLPELYYRLATRFRHFLIDEFQDTSKLQWDNLFLMVEDALAADGSLFYVGDRKQAIYRFRGGEVSLMDTVREHFSAFNLTTDTLTVNYRSNPVLVDFINHVFSPENLEKYLMRRLTVSVPGNDFRFTPREMREIIAVYANAHQSPRPDKKGGYVQAQFFDEKGADELEARIRSEFCARMQELMQRFSPSEIAVLARTNLEVQRLTAWLLETGIPVASEKTLDIQQNPYIKEIVSFLRFLQSPIDNLSFASFILGEIFQAASGISAQNIRGFLFSLRRRQAGRTNYLYREFREAFPGSWETLLEEFFRSVGYVPLYELLVSIYARFGVMDRFAGCQGFFMRLLELVQEQKEKRHSIGSFLSFFDRAPQEELYVNVTTSDAVRVLTVHKAKGLEFPVVILPFVSMQAEVHSPVAVEVEGNVQLMRLKAAYRGYSPLLEKLYRREYRMSFIDELNSLYVAFTRAREELYLYIPLRRGRGRNPVTGLLGDNNVEYGLVQSARRPASVPTPARVVPVSRYGDWIRFLKEECADGGVLRHRKAITRGEVLHALLSATGNLYAKDIDEVLSVARDEVKEMFPLFEGFDEAYRLIRRLLTDERYARIFSVKDAEVFCEHELVDRCGRTWRLDRLVVTGEEATVVDYKSSAAEGGDYQEQLRNYMRIVAEMYPKKRLRGALLYLDTLTLEEV